MKNDFETVYETLHEIYQKHRRAYRENGDSKQMCCMWSTDDPPDVIEGTPPFDDIENVFDITIDDAIALELYDMDLDEAARRIMEMRTKKMPTMKCSVFVPRQNVFRLCAKPIGPGHKSADF